MKLNMKFKNKEVSFEANTEKIVEKSIENHEKNWKEKFESKHEAKKDILKLKHKQKLELEDKKLNKKNMYQLKLEEQMRKEEIKQLKEQQKNQQTIRNVSIILIFIYGLFCITGFRDNHIASAIVSLIQICLLIVSILMCENVFHLFKKDYKILFIISILLIIVWTAFAI